MSAKSADSLRIAKVRFDPKLPVSINNPYPLSKWPFKLNEKVLVLLSSGTIMKATVRWYNPAFHGTMTVTKGASFFTVDVGQGGMPVVAAHHVTEICAAGRAYLLRQQAKTYSDEINRMRALAEEKSKARDALLDSAFKVEKRIRGMSPLPRAVTILQRNPGGRHVLKDGKTGATSPELFGAYEIRQWLKSIGYRVKFGK